jgi:hypothetical protein
VIVIVSSLLPIACFSRLSGDVRATELDGGAAGLADGMFSMKGRNELERWCRRYLRCDRQATGAFHGVEESTLMLPSGLRLGTIPH